MIGDKDGQTYEDYGWSLIESLSELYTNMIHHGVAPEQARLILPLNMMVKKTKLITHVGGMKEEELDQSNECTSGVCPIR